CGVDREVLVAISLERRVETLAVILGILKAGGAYVPLDSAYPDERIAYMLRDSAAPIFITDRPNASDSPGFAGRCLRFEELWAQAQTQPTDPLPSMVVPANLAYM